MSIIMIAKAEHQIIGYIANKRGESLGQLVDGMGLTWEEWDDIKKTLSGLFDPE